MIDEQFWVAISFSIFILASYKPVCKLITEALDERAKKIKNNLDQAYDLKLEAEKALALIKQKQRETEYTIKEIIAQTEKESSSLYQQALIELDKKLIARKKAVRAKMESKKNSLISEITELAINKAMDAVHIILKNNMNKDTSLLLIKNSINDIKHNQF